jgi:hypothetical protein
MGKLKKKIPHLKECPPAGTGNHSWLYYAACTLVDAEFTDAEAEPILRERMKRLPQPTEITDALTAARRTDKPPTQKWPCRDFEQINQISDEVDEWVPERPNAATEPTLRLLFPGDPLVCIGKSAYDFTTGRLSGFRFLNAYSFIVPSAMSKLEGKTQKGTLSSHSLDNTGPRQYQVVEFDWGSIEKQMKLIYWLGCHCEPLQLVMVVHSGSKSAHAWFDCRGIPEDTIKTFFESAVRCGADSRLWLRSQFCRMPGGTRDNGKVQSILYLADKWLSARAKSFLNPST